MENEVVTLQELYPRNVIILGYWNGRIRENSMMPVSGRIYG
jgi:hypothetical protein